MAIQLESSVLEEETAEIEALCDELDYPRHDTEAELEQNVAYGSLRAVINGARLPVGSDINICGKIHSVSRQAVVIALRDGGAVVLRLWPHQVEPNTLNVGDCVRNWNVPAPHESFIMKVLGTHVLLDNGSMMESDLARRRILSNK